MFNGQVYEIEHAARRCHARLNSAQKASCCLRRTFSCCSKPSPHHALASTPTNASCGQERAVQPACQADASTCTQYALIAGCCCADDGVVGRFPCLQRQRWFVKPPPAAASDAGQLSSESSSLSSFRNLRMRAALTPKSPFPTRDLQSHANSPVSNCFMDLRHRVCIGQPHSGLRLPAQSKQA